jgi:hypothetical protein
VKKHRDFILGSGSTHGVLLGGLLEIIVALTGIGTAVTLYPVSGGRTKAPRLALSLLASSRPA